MLVISQFNNIYFKFAYGTHHTKLSLYETENAIHCVVMTANLVEEDWALVSYYYIIKFVNKNVAFRKLKHFSTVALLLDLKVEILQQVLIINDLMSGCSQVCNM